MDPVGKRRLAWALFAVFNLTSGVWLTTIANWQAYWLLGLAASIATVPMLVRTPSKQRWHAWAPTVMAMTIAVVAIVRLLL